MAASKNILVSIYSHAELYPPTLNAVSELAKHYDKVILLQRAHLQDTWLHPANVMVISHGKLMTAREQETLPIYSKISLFLSFIFTQIKLIRKYKPARVLVYDNLALFAYHIARRFIPKTSVWYHNHDIGEIERLRKYSIGWFSLRSEPKAFRYIDIFTLPAIERKKYFDLEKWEGFFYVLPNYPAANFFNRFYKHKTISETDEIRLIYQGHASEKHGLEEIIALLNNKIKGKSLKLVLKGPCQDSYRLKLEQLASENEIPGKIEFLGISAYEDVPLASSACHIGIGIHAKEDIMNTSLGSASNKLYEYAAVGLPILYYDNIHFNAYLSRYSWAVATNLQKERLLESIEKIIADYDNLSAAANKDFNQGLNFELHFNTFYAQLVHSVK